MEVVAAFVSNAKGNSSGAWHKRLYKLPRISAVNIALEVRDGGALARDHPFHQITDRDHADNLITIEHGQMANMFVSHETQAFFDRLARMRDGQVS